MPLPRSWDGTWLAYRRDQKVVKRRLLLLGCIASGLIQKPVISVAWDMLVFQKIIAKLCRAKASCHLVGCTAILLRQVFAARAQETVAELAMALATAGKCWACSSLRTLLGRLEMLPVRDAGKRRGRMSQYTGPRWIQKLLSSPKYVSQFRQAGARIGKAFDTSATADAMPTFHQLCLDLKGESRLPLVGKYSVPHLVRACSAARQFVDGVLLEVCPAAWEQHLRAMHDDRTTNQFNLLEVHSHDDATAMLRTVVQSARAFSSFRTATPFGRASFIDLPCQVCELAGVLGSVKAYRGALAHAGATRDRLDDVDWLLARLPGSGPDIKKMSKSAKMRSSRIVGRGNGMDLQCAGHVAKGWLRSHPLRLQSSLLDVWGACRGGPFLLPRVLCLKCNCVLDGDSNTRLALCTVCRTRRRRIWDAERQRTRRST